MIQSGGLLVYRKNAGRIEVFLTHPGGPFWAKKDVWSIPKGEAEEGETLEDAARREFLEETGIVPPAGDWFDLGEAKASSKLNHIWAVEGDVDIHKFHCDSQATMEWPPRSGQQITFPENDRAEWFELPAAATKVYKSQAVFIERLADHLGIDLTPVEQPTNATLF